MSPQNHSATHADDDFILSPSPTLDALREYSSAKYIAHRLSLPVAHNQLWIAEQNDEAEYVMVTGLSPDRRCAAVVPLSLSPGDVTEQSLVVKDTPLKTTMIAWPEMGTVIPVRLLSRPLDEFTFAVARCIALNKSDDRVGVIRAHDQEEDIPYVRSHYRALRHRLAQWHALCNKLPKLHDDDERESITPNRAEYARALVQVLGLTFHDAEDIIEKKATLTDAQLQQLAAAGVHQDDSRPRTFHLPKDLLVEVEQPLYWEAAENLSSTYSDDPRYHLAKDAFTLAARKSGEGRESWRGVLSNVIHGIRETDESE